MKTFEILAGYVLTAVVVVAVLAGMYSAAMAPFVLAEVLMMFLGD